MEKVGRPSPAAGTSFTSSVFYHWKRRYSWGKFDNKPIEKAALKGRIEQLERLVGN